MATPRDPIEQPEQWLVELLEELRSEEAEAAFRQVEREVRLPVVIDLAAPGGHDASG